MLQRFAILMSAAGLTFTVACAETDPGITTAVKAKLAADETVKAYQIDVDTSNHVVTLTGIVETPAAEAAAIAIARQTDGVTDVVDRITVSAAAATSPENLREQTKETADSAADATRNAAERGAEATKGVAGDAADKIGTAAERTGEAITDAAVTSAVKGKFLADTSTPGMKIDVDTKDGVVTLSGTVRSSAEADRAVALARETNGVKRVVNNLKVAA